MTNKKFKIAAMSMALTACVAAQPLMANAADTDEVKEPVSNANENEAEGSAVAEEPTVQDNADEGDKGTGDVKNEKPADGSNKEEDNLKEAFGEDVDIDYGDPKTDDKTGDTIIKGDVVKKDEATDDQDKTDGTEGDQKTDEVTPPPPSDGDKTEKDEKDEGEKIGDATITETPGSTVTEEPVKKPGAEPVTKTDTKVDSDGTTTITDTTTVEGTQTTTTTGSGHAEADSKETTEDTDKVDKDFLDKELGNIGWNVKQNDKVGTDEKNQYTVIDKKEETTGSKTKQTLTLEKVKKTSGNMSAEDIAKLVDADRDSLNKQEDGSYTLKRTETVTDEDGNPVTRTTYITVKNSEVTITTTTTITVTREKEEHHKEGSETVSNNFELPDITITDKATSASEKITSAKLKELLEKAKADPTANGKYTVEDGNREYTITVDKEASHLSGDELAQKLHEKLGENFTADSDKVFYVDANGEKWELSIEQTAGIREILSYTVDVKEKNEGSETRVEDGKDPQTEKNNARINAVRNALNRAVADLLYKKEITDDEADELMKAIANADVDIEKGGTFTATVDGKEFKLDYTKATLDIDESTPKDTEEKADVTDVTVTGEAFVTGGSASWGGSKSDYDIISGKIDSGISSDFTVPKDATSVVRDGKTIYTYEKDGKTYELTYSTPDEAQLKLIEQKLRKKGLSDDDIKTTLSNENFQWVSWKVTDIVTKDDTDTIESVDLRKGDIWNWNPETGTLTITHEDKTTETYTGLTYDETTQTYTGTDAADPNKSYKIQQKNSGKLGDEEIKKLLKDKYGDVTIINKDTVAYVKDGKTYTLKFSNLGTNTLEVTTSVKSTFSDVSEDELTKTINAELNGLQEGEELLIGNKVVTKKDSEFWLDGLPTNTTTINTIIKDAILSYVDFNNLSKEDLIKLLLAEKAAADKADHSYDEGTEFGHADLDIETDLKDEKGNSLGDAYIIGSPNYTFGHDAADVVAGKAKGPTLAAEATYDDSSKKMEYRGEHYNYTANNYYSVTGTVAYGKDQSYSGYYAESAAKQRAKELGGDAVAVETSSGTWTVFKHTASLTAYGYMDTDSNTCRDNPKKTSTTQYNYGGGSWGPDGGWGRSNGYDLLLKNLTLVNGKVVAQSKTTYSAVLTKRTTSTNAYDALKLTSLSHDETRDLFSGTGYSGTYDVSYEQNFSWKDDTSSGMQGKGEKHYTTFRDWLYRFFHGESGEKTKDDGSFTYKYDYTTVGDLQGEHLTQTVEKHAEANYDYTTEETKDVEITIDQVITVITPDDDDPVPPVIPVVTPETPVTPANPELPPVQDAQPDVVLPAEAESPVLPAVQDAHALPQTGVNWFTAIAMAVSGFALMAAGAFASLTGKNAKH